MKKEILATEAFADEIEIVERKFLANELIYLLTTMEGMEELEAAKQVMELTDEDLVDQVNTFYEGSGTTYEME